MVLVLILNAMLGSMFVLGKYVLSFTTPIFFVGTSMTLGGFLLLLMQYFRNRKSIKILREDVLDVIEISFFMVAFSYGLQFWGMQYLPAFKVCFLYNFGPISSYLIAWLFFKQRMQIQKWLGLIVGFIGLIPILLSTTEGESVSISLGFLSMPEIAIISSAIAYAYSWFLIKDMVYNKGYQSATVNGYSMFIGGLFMLGILPYIEGIPVIADLEVFVIGLLGTVLIEYMICNNLYAWLLHHYSETFISFSTFLVPLFGAFYSWMFLKETITWHFFLSFFIVSFAMWLFYAAEMKENPTHSPD